MNRRDFHKTLGAAIASLSANNLWAAPTPTRTPTAPVFLRDRLQRYNPVWTTPSNSSLGSMPLSGSQGTALNVWVQDGAVCFYIARNDAYNEDGNLAFFGPGFDWIPDHNWGGTSMIGLQSMLVAPADKGMHLLPAWPEDWTAEFRLHLPEQGILSARVESGQIHDLEVTTPTGKPYPHPIVQPTPS